MEDTYPEKNTEIIPELSKDNQTEPALSQEDAENQAPEPTYNIIVTLKQREDWHEFHVVFPLTDLKKEDWIKFQIDGRDEVAKIVAKPIKVILPLASSVNFIRTATPEDMEKYKENLEKEQRAKELCIQFNEELGITKMDLTRVESYMDGSKIIFYYYSEGRIDFRELVKQLVKTLKSRIEMRQIGIRHEAKMVGGAAHCGREMCCCLYLNNFKPVTLKMARDQNLIPNPSKLSGRCGRLLCCLRYELEESYQDAGLEDEVIELNDLSDSHERHEGKKRK